MRARLLDRLFGLADDATDDDDLRLRKRVAVVAGYILIVAATMPVVSAGNLLFLARTHRFDRYVTVLVVMVLGFAAVIEVALGGLGGSSAAIVFAFLGPVFALLALGPRRATAWFVAFLAVVNDDLSAGAMCRGVGARPSDDPQPPVISRWISWMLMRMTRAMRTAKPVR